MSPSDPIDRPRATPIPEPAAEAPWWRRVFGPILAGAWAVVKFGAPVLKFLPAIFKTGGSMLLSIGAYALLYGWKFAAGFVLLIFVHEAGHLVAARLCGLKAGAPVFIPFLGARIALQDAPKNAWVEAVVGIGGPLFGTIGGVACVVLGIMFQSPLMLALASATFFLQLFNLMPIIPLDGGRVVAAISPWLWIAGLALLVPFILLSFSGPGLYILIIVAMSLPRVWRSFRDRNDPEVRRYFEAKPWQRGLIAASYFGLLAFLGVAWLGSHAVLETISV